MADPKDGKPGEGERLNSDAPRSGRQQPPRGAPFRQPHGAQRRPARAHPVGPVLGPHVHTNRTRNTRVAEPWPPIPAKDGQQGWGQRLTPDAPRSSGRPPPGTAAHQPSSMQPPAEHAHQGDSAGPPHSRTCAHSRWVADPGSTPDGGGRWRESA